MPTEIEPPTASTSSLLTDRIDANDSLATPTSRLWITLDKPTTVVDAYPCLRQLPTAFCAADRLNTTPAGRLSTTSLGSVNTLAEA
jgi:hypothetical protein